jgi:DNA-binding FadR family transcriptional regulator
MHAPGALSTDPKGATDGFSPLARRGFTSDSIGAVKGMIIDGRLRPGDRLPSERALSEALGVSRPTVREAIRSLQAMNIVETRQGSGRARDPGRARLAMTAHIARISAAAMEGVTGR